MSMIQTVLGPVAPEKLGLTTMHEHVLCDVSDALAPMVKAYRAKIPTQSLALVPENLASLRSGMSVFSQECCPAGDVAYTRTPSPRRLRRIWSRGSTTKAKPAF